MPSVSPLRSVSLPIAHESSRLVSPRESDSVLKQYKRANTSNQQIDSALQAVNLALRKLEGTRRRILGGGGVAGTTKWMPFRGEYSPTAAYAVQDVVVIRTGSNSGSFVCIAANNGQAPQSPDIGNLYWVSLSGNVPAGGNWMT